MDAERGEGPCALPARRLWAAALAVLAAATIAATGAGSARADGDPASDYLITQNVYFPYRLPSEAVRAALERAADDVYAHGERVKLALIYDATDLGAIPSLFGRPVDYAHFLGLEIGPWYVGPLARRDAGRLRRLRRRPIDRCRGERAAKGPASPAEALTTSPAARR